VLVEPSLSASPRGYLRTLALARAHAPGLRAFAIEGTGSYGAGLARFLAEQGERVHEVERPQRAGVRSCNATLLALDSGIPEIEVYQGFAAHPPLTCTGFLDTTSMARGRFRPQHHSA
jgi:hypothetical protein